MPIVIWFLAQLAAGAPPSVAAAPSPLEQECLRQLLAVHRIYVDRLNGGETAGQMRDMLISSLQNSRLFLLTENQDRADAILRGSAEDLVFTDQHSSSDGINAHANIGVSRSSGTNTRYGGHSGNSDSAGVGFGENESMRSVERRHEATAAVRLVNKDGDVIWSTTEESLGGKFRGASADVADKITGRLSEDYQRARRLK